MQIFSLLDTWATSEYSRKLFKKGSKVNLEDQLETRKWQDDTGAARYSAEIFKKLTQSIESLQKRPFIQNRTNGYPPCLLSKSSF